MKNIISDGIYLVVNPAMDLDKVLNQLDILKKEQLSAVQIWDNPETTNDLNLYIEGIIDLFKSTGTPVLINNKWERLTQFKLDGVHFDRIPKDISKINERIGRDYLKGLTLTNDLSFVKTADKLRFDYLSFCAVFPSQTSQSCELVSFDSIVACRNLTKMPIFLSGGITPDKLPQFKPLEFNGVAVVSGIMNAKNPLYTLRHYQDKLSEIIQPSAI